MSEEGKNQSEESKDQPAEGGVGSDHGGREAQRLDAGAGAASIAPQPLAGKLTVYSLGFLAVLLVILLGWQMAARESERRRAEAALDSARGDGLMLAAGTAAAALQPIMTLRGHVPEITDGTLQSVCELMLRSDRFDLVAITDSSGKVLASSDLALVGRDFEGIEVGESELKKVRSGERAETWRASTPVRVNDAPIGMVILRARPD